MNTITRNIVVPCTLMSSIVLTLTGGETPQAKDSHNQRKAAIEKFLPTSTNLEHKLINSNNAYLAKALAGRASIDPLLENTEKLRAKLKETIKAQKHAHSEVPITHSGKADVVDHLSKSQLLRISIVMDDLLNGDLVKDIGKIMDSAKENEEAGGLVLIKEGKVHFKSLPNASTGTGSPQFIANYLFPDDSFEEPHLFLFHTHPYIKGQGTSNGPSWDIRGNRYGAAVRGDIGVASSMAKHYGESHHLVVSTFGDPKDKMFNIDYFGGEAINAKEPKTAFDVGSMLDHMRVLDLGIFRY